MPKGVVKFFNQTKGFGIINVDGTGMETFVHISGLKDKIQEGDTVVFDLIINGKKGLSAVNVKLI
jgi:CspA family cold shock protein